MTRAHKLKRAVRARARKTGESYAAARRQVLAARSKTARVTGPEPDPPSAPAPAPASAGAVSDARVRAATGHELAHWFALLDAFGALDHGHTAAARHLREAHGVSSWYSQGITVAYERARGRRALNQRVTGEFAVSVSKTLAVPLERVQAALERPAERAAWLAGAEPGLSRALESGLRAPRSRPGARASARGLRLRYGQAGQAVEIRVEPLSDGRSRLSVAISKLAGAADVDRQRRAWRAALLALAAHLA
jgi:hypothetical protein